MSTDLTGIKARVNQAATAAREAALKLSHDIHANPELGFQEHEAMARLTSHLEDRDFRVTRGIGGLETAFRADYGNGQPVIGLMAEYDALPEIGHACGHNVIAGTAVTAAVAARAAVDALGGTVSVCGTPGEEGLGGKSVMAEAGAFSDLDAAMMVHPGVKDVACPGVLAAWTITVEYFGQAAHAAADPEAGINALDAMILAFSAINALRQHIPDSARVHGIITDGGQAPNIIPAHSAATLMVRAADNAYLAELAERVIHCFEAGAGASGARLEYRWEEHPYAALVSNHALAALFAANMRTLGRDYPLDAPAEQFGSTDMGNVSLLVPSIHPLVAITPRRVAIHSPEFARAAVSKVADRGLMDGARALALTVTDLLADPACLRAVKEEFNAGSGV